MRVFLLAMVVMGCCGCAGPTGRKVAGQPGESATPAEAIGALVGKSDVIVVGRITGIRDATARDGGIVYDVVLRSVLLGGDGSAEVLRFRSAGGIGYAKYHMDDDVLLFLRRHDGELVQVMPVCYIEGEPTSGALDFRPLSQYRGYIDEAIQNRNAK